MEKEYKEPLAKAQLALRQGSPGEAFTAFRPVLHYPGMVEELPAFVEAVQVFAEISEALANEDFTSSVREVIRKPKNAQALYQLGYNLIEQRLYDIAATILTRAHALKPNDAHILSELVCALSGMSRNKEACQVLRARPALLQRDYLSRYLLAFNSIMAGDLETARGLLPSLEQMRHEYRDVAVGIIAPMLARADTLIGVSALDERDLRGWHFVATGGMLLHLSPYGFDEGMNGRYAFIQDSLGHCLEGIQRLEIVLRTLEVTVPRVFSLPERGSEILAYALAQRLRVPLESWTEGGRMEAGLIVAYDLGNLDEPLLETLREHRPGQILWSHAACWTEPTSFVADFTTFLYQVNHAPWASQLRVDPATNEPAWSSEDERESAVIAEGILRAELEEDALKDISSLQAMAKAVSGASSAAIPGFFLTRGPRNQFYENSPVKSSRFGPL